MRWRPAFMLLLLVALATTGGALHYDEMPEEWRMPRDLPAPRSNVGEPPAEGTYTLVEGHSLELVADGLTYPSMITWDGDGRLLVAESGYAFGPSTAIPRILAIEDDGSTSELVRLPDGPVTSIAFHDGVLYAIGGRDPARVWTIDLDNGSVNTLLSGFPVWGRHFTSDLAFDDGWVYFAVGDPTNAGVLGLDDYYTYGYLSIFPGARSIPCVDLRLRGHQTFAMANPMHPDPNATVETAPFHRFAEPGRPNETIQASSAPGCNGAVFRARLDGSDLQVFATGLRNVHGLGFGPDGALLAVEEAMRPSGSRPVDGACDALWRIEQGGWYGFPDHSCGRPVTDPELHPANRSAPQLLLQDPPPLADGPLHEFEANSGTRHFTVVEDEASATVLLVAQAGSHFEYPPQGHRVVRLDLEADTEEVLYANLEPGPNGTAPERPYAIRTGPDGAFYLVDQGRLVTTTKTFHPSALTGAVWRIVPDTVADT